MIDLDRIERILTRAEALKFPLGEVEISNNEVALIVKYLERLNTKVTDAFYYNEGLALSDTIPSLPIGHSSGVVGKIYFFGNVMVNVTLSGVTLPLVNFCRARFLNSLKGFTESNYIDCYMSCGNGLIEQQAGVYHGYHRIYQIGFDYITIDDDVSGGASLLANFGLNGYVFVMK